MNYLFENLKKNLDAVSFFVEFDKRLSKNEHNFFIFLMEQMQKQKNGNILAISEENIAEKLEINKKSEILPELMKFSRKNIFYFFETEGEEGIKESGLFNLIYSFRKNNGNYYLTMAKELEEAAKAGSIFNYFHLNTLLKFKLSCSIKLYQRIFRYFSNNKGFELSVQSIRELFDMNDSYERFYDFEKNVFQQVIKDINDYSDYQLSYEKLKINDGKTNKVVSIKFSYYSKNAQKLQKESNKLFALVKEYVKDFDTILKTIKKYLEENDYKYVKENINFAIQHYESDFDEFLMEALDKNYVSSYFQEKTQNLQGNFVILAENSKHYSSIFKLESDLYQYLSNLKFYYDFEFITLLHQLKITNKIEYSGEKIKIFVEYNKVGNSHIKIYGIEG